VFNKELHSQPVASCRTLTKAELGKALNDAAFNGDARSVAAWLDEGGCVDARWAERGDMTLLMGAAYGGQEAMVRMLLQRGASVNLQDFVGCNALMGAALNGITPAV